MPDPLLDTLSNPFVLAIISNVATGIVFYFIGRSSRRADRKQAHSVQLKDSALVPWSKLGIYHQDVWNEAGIPRFVADPSPNWDEPVYQWAKAHLKKADPGILHAWEKAQEALDKEKAQVEVVKQTIQAQFAKQVGAEVLSTPMRALSTKDESLLNVYYEDAIAYIAFMDVKNILKNLPDQRKYFGVDFTTETISSGAAYLGTKVMFGAMEIARLQRQTDASVERWKRILNGTVSSEIVRQSMRVVMERDAEAEMQLAIVKKGLRAQIQMIENGKPIAGKCELGY